MKNLALFLISFLTASVTAFGQYDTVPQKKTSGGGGGFTIGYGNMNVSPLHTFVPDNLRQFSNEHLLLGGTGHAVINRFVIGGSGSGIIGSTVSTDTLKANVGGGMGTFDMGYLLLNREQVKLYPLIGIGGGGFGLQVSRSGSISTNTVSNNPGREINLSIGSFLADISINIDLLPTLSYNEETGARESFMTGLRLGYVYSIPTSDWKYAGGSVSGGPDFGFNMFYLKLIIGGFGYKNK